MICLYMIHLISLTRLSRGVLSNYLVFVIVFRNGEDILQIFGLSRFWEACNHEASARFHTTWRVNIDPVHTFQILWRAKRFLKNPIDWKIFNNIQIQVDLVWNSNVERQTSTLSQNSFFVFSSCAIVKWFYSLTFSCILVKAKKGISSLDLFQYIYVIFSLSDKPDWFLSIA